MQGPGATSAVNLALALLPHLDQKEKLALPCLGTKPFLGWPHRIQERAPCLRAWGLPKSGAPHFIRLEPTRHHGRERALPTLAPKCSALAGISSWAPLGPLAETAAKP